MTMINSPTEIVPGLDVARADVQDAAVPIPVVRLTPRPNPPSAKAIRIRAQGGLRVVDEAILLAVFTAESLHDLHGGQHLLHHAHRPALQLLEPRSAGAPASRRRG